MINVNTEVFSHPCVTLHYVPVSICDAFSMDPVATQADECLLQQTQVHEHNF